MRDTWLVTGCAGYLGSSFVGDLLARGNRVLGLDNLTFGNGFSLLPYLGHPNFEFLAADVRQLEDYRSWLRRADAVAHFAALVGAPLCDRLGPDETWRTNRDATVAIAAALSPHQLLLWPNTNSGYGKVEGNGWCTEDTPMAPLSSYARSKCGAEKYVLDHKLGCSLRLATVFGASPRPRLDLLVNDFTARLVQLKTVIDEGELSSRAFTYAPLTIYEGNFQRNFVHIRDVARAMLHVGVTVFRPGCYNVAPQRVLTKMQLAHLIADQLGLSSNVVTEGHGKDPDQRDYRVSSDRLLSTGFEFRHTVEQGVAEVAEMVRLLPAYFLARCRNA